MDGVIERFFKDVQLSDIVLWLCCGYIFIGIVRFITQSKDENDYKYTILKSFVLGYLFVQFFKTIPSMTSNDDFNVLMFLCFVTIVAYLCGMFYSSNLIQKILSIFRISSVTRTNVWGYMRDGSYSVWVKLINIEKGITIFGMWEYTENNDKFPIITLVRHSIYCDNKDINYNNNHIYTKKLLVDTSKYDIIEFKYNKDSTNIRIREEEKENDDAKSKSVIKEWFCGKKNVDLKHKK